MGPFSTSSYTLSAGSAAALLRRMVTFATMLAATMGVVAMGWADMRLRDDARAATGHMVRVAELRGTIAYLNEWTSMSARAAVLSGESRWLERYDEAAPKLDAAITEAASLASPKTRAALDSTTGEAHRDLVTMERRALALAGAGDLASARALLDGPEFDYLQQVYATGIEVFGQDLASFTKARTNGSTDRAWLEALGLAFGVVILVATCLAVRGRTRLRRLAREARTDPLTGLMNRKALHETVDIVLANRSGQGHALLLIDLNRFKIVNEAHGRAAGDELLQLAAARLRDVVRGNDPLARVEGDEFALVLRVDHGSTRLQRPPDAIAARIIAAMAVPFALADGTAVEIGASVGIAYADAEPMAASAFVHRAEVALSRAKVDGRQSLRAFEPWMDAEVRSRALLEGDLRQAIATGVIEPHYQPLVDLRTGALIGVEMLARWFHPTRGPVPPDVFIPLAEELGVIGFLTERLLLRACRDAAQWPNALTLACNLSPLQLRDPDLPRGIGEMLAEAGFSPARLELEITESALVGDPELARGLLGQLRALGVRLALDDFGTGYSSLRHLQTLPFDKIKIDRSFVAAMAGDPESRKIVAAVVGLGHSLGLVTVAEGIETEAIAGQLRSLGCDVGQGWLYGRPVPADRIAALLGLERRAEPSAA